MKPRPIYHAHELSIYVGDTIQVFGQIMFYYFISCMNNANQPLDSKPREITNINPLACEYEQDKPLQALTTFVISY